MSLSQALNQFAQNLGRYPLFGAIVEFSTHAMEEYDVTHRSYERGINV